MVQVLLLIFTCICWILLPSPHYGFSEIIPPLKKAVHPKQYRDMKKKILSNPKKMKKYLGLSKKKEVDDAPVWKLDDEERIQKVIAHAGLASRRDAEKLIQRGRVVLNGQKVRELGTKMNPKKDKLIVDGKLVFQPKREEIHWVMLNKPRGTLTTVSDDKNRETVLKYIPKANQLRLLPVGRMDRDTSGLFLLTNEVGWIHMLTHPAFPSYQRFEVVVKGPVDRNALILLSYGKLIDPRTNRAFPAIPMDIIEVQPGKLITLDCVLDNIPAAIIFDIIPVLKCQFVSSRRIEFGPIRLKSLKRGDWRELTLKEVTLLKEFCDKKKSTKKKSFSEKK